MASFFFFFWHFENSIPWWEIKPSFFSCFLCRWHGLFFGLLLRVPFHFPTCLWCTRCNLKNSFKWIVFVVLLGFLDMYADIFHQFNNYWTLVSENIFFFYISLLSIWDSKYFYCFVVYYRSGCFVLFLFFHSLFSSCFSLGGVSWSAFDFTDSFLYCT